MKSCYCLCCLFIVTMLLSRESIAQESVGIHEDKFLDSLLNIHISTAAKYSQTMQEAPASITIITSEDIRRFGYQTVKEALCSVPGIYFSDDRSYAYLGIRGFGRPTDYNDRILLLLNGHTLNESYYGSTEFGNELGLNMESIECIEIVRGPGSVLYGTGAMFGVINIITKEGHTIDGGTISVEGGSFKRYQGAFSIGKRLNEDIEYSAAAIYGDSRGANHFYPEFYEPGVRDGISRNLDWEKYSGLQYRIAYKELAFTGHFNSRKKGIPTASFDISFNDPRAQTIDEHQFYEIQLNHDLSIDKNLFVRGYYDAYVYKGQYPTPDYFNADENIVRSEGAELRFRWDLNAGNRLIAGTEYTNKNRIQYQSWYDQITYYDKDFPYWLLSLYAQDEIQILADFMLTAGIRYDHYSSIGNTINPRASLVYFASGATTLKLLYGEAYRAPNIYEMYYEDVGTPQIGNPNLSTEKIRTYECVWEKRFTRQILGTFSVYYYNMNNLIDLMEDSIASVLQFRNTRNVGSTGFECSFIYSFGTQWKGYLNYAYQYARDLDSKAKLTNSPSHLFQSGVGFPIYREFSGGVECRYESSRGTVYQATTRPYFITNLNVNIQPPSQHIQASVQVRNVFNTWYATPGGLQHRQSAITQDGRTFTVRLDYIL